MVGSCDQDIAAGLTEKPPGNATQQGLGNRVPALCSQGYEIHIAASGQLDQRLAWKPWKDGSIRFRRARPRPCQKLAAAVPDS